MGDKKRILVKLLIITAAMFVVDRGVGAFLKHFYFTQKNGFDYRTNYAMNVGTPDVLIFGSSRAAYHYDTKVLADSLHMSVYNAGRDLTYIYYHYAVLEGALKRYSPKLVILDTRPNEFQKFRHGEDYERLNILLPYYDSNPVVPEISRLRGPLEQYKMWSKIYPYNSLILHEMVELLPIAKYKKDDSQNGYIPKSGQWKGGREPYTVNDEVDSVAASYYKKFIAACKAKHIKLIVAYSPIYQQLNSQSNRNINFVTQLCKEHNVPMINYLDDKQFDNPALFFDGLHLNHVGAAVYSGRIVGQVKEVLAEK